MVSYRDIERDNIFAIVLGQPQPGVRQPEPLGAARSQVTRLVNQGDYHSDKTESRQLYKYSKLNFCEGCTVKQIKIKKVT